MTFQSSILCVLDSAIAQMRASSVHQAMHLLSQDVENITGVPHRHISARLMQREELASSAIGAGVAIPHLRLKNTQKPLMILASLASPIDFDAPDRLPVDLIMLVTSPDADGPLHLRRLARASRLMRDEALCHALRSAKTPDKIQSLVLSAGDTLLAA